MVSPSGTTRSFARSSGAVRENEVLRISALIGGGESGLAADVARRQVLAWAQNRCGGRLPAEAWTFDSFDYVSGGRNSSGIRLQSGGTDVWALRADDPDRTVAGRIWTTEVVIAHAEGIRPRLSVRLIANTSETDFLIEPHSPGFVMQLAEQCGLHQSRHEFSVEPWLVDSPEDFDQLSGHLLDPDRRFPVLVLSLREGENSVSEAPLDAHSLARATLGMASVVVMTANAARIMISRFGEMRSVRSGAVRAYLCGFSLSSSPYDHRLIVAKYLSDDEQKQRAERWMRSIAASESVRRNRIGQDIISFRDIRSSSLKSRQEALKDAGASDEEQLKAAQARIAALENDVEKERAAQEGFALEADEAEERAVAAEAQHRASSLFIQHLQSQLAAQGATPPPLAIPTTWPDFAAWCDSNLAGRVSLAPAARRNCRSASFSDVSLAARCLIWLATDYRDGRMNGASGDFVDFPVEDGIRNSLCGGDEFDFMWQGRRQTADWHIKNGGNTRDPNLCLRIYYFWDEDDQQVIIADMPSHRPSGAS